MMILQLTARPSLWVRYACLPTFSLTVLLLLAATRLSAQPTNDSCAVARVLALPGVGEDAITVTGHNIGATPELPASVFANCTPGGIFSGLGADVWYTFVPSENACFDFTVVGLMTPEITIRRGTDCYNTSDILCEASNNGTVSATATLEADSTYYLRVSGANYADQGYFQLTTDRVFCFTDDGCVLLDGLSASPEPNVFYYQEQEVLSYNPGTTVNFCYTVGFWFNNGDNWLHSVQIDLGEAWDLNSLTAFPPNACNSSGEWNWYEEWTSCNTGETFGPGFAFDSSSGIGCGGTPGDLLPGNNFGDGPDQCGTWEFCWTVSVKTCEQIEEDMSSTALKVEVTALSDGRSGAYTIVACDTEVDATLDVRTGCDSGEGDGDGCLIPVAEGSTTNVSCVDQMDGTFTIDADDADLPSNVYLYDLNDNLIEAFIGVQLPFTSPAILDTGFYGILLETPDIELEGFCPGYFISIINITLPFEPIADYTQPTACNVDSVQLSGGLWPETTEGVSYDWVGPNDFASSVSDPYVTEPGQYILTVNKDGCRISDTVEVVFSVPLDLQVNQINSTLCVGDELVLTAGGAGPAAQNYEWIIPPDADIATPVFDPVDLTWDFNYINENVDLQLVGFDTLGCSDTINFTALVNVPPSSAFSLTGNDLTYQFQPTAPEEAGYQYTWTFGDGNESSEYAPEHTYATQGTYEVQLITENECGADTSQQTISILFPPEAAFTTSDATEGCAPLTITFTNQSTNAETYAWSFPGGDPATSTAANPTVTYDDPGTYAVQLTATNAAGESVSLVEDYVTVLPTPSGSFSFSTNLLAAQFTSAANDTDTYFWDFGDGSSSSMANPVHVYEIGGTYTVTLVMTNDCGTEVIFQEVTVSRPIPEVGFSTEDMREGCAPLTITFANESENATSYAWTFPGGEPTTSTEVNPTVLYSTPGVYDVQLNAINEAGTNSLLVQVYVTVLGPPTGSFTYATDALEVQFTSDDQDVDSHAWDFGDGTNSDLINPTHTYAESGTYTVTLVITNACGSTTITQTISVDANAVPSVAFTTMGDRTGCPPFEVQFVNQSSGADTYQWTFPGGTPASSTAPDPVVTYTTPGTYLVNLTATNANGDSMLTQLDYIEVFPLPFGEFTTELDMLTATFTSITQNVDSYSWQFGDGTTSNEANPVHTYAEPGDYQVILTVENECASVSIESTITVTVTSVGALTETAQWALYPNPTQGPLWLATTDWPTATTTQVVVFNALGERLSTQAISLAASDNRIPLLFDLPAGVYWLRLEGKQLAGEMRKVIVQ